MSLLLFEDLEDLNVGVMNQTRSHSMKASVRSRKVHSSDSNDVSRRALLRVGSSSAKVD
jgi:hypothetical protein